MKRFVWWMMGFAGAAALLTTGACGGSDDDDDSSTTTTTATGTGTGTGTGTSTCYKCADYTLACAQQCPAGSPFDLVCDTSLPTMVDLNECICSPTGGDCAAECAGTCSMSAGGGGAGGGTGGADSGQGGGDSATCMQCQAAAIQATCAPQWAACLDDAGI